MIASIPCRRASGLALGALSAFSASVAADWSDPDLSYGNNGLARVDLGNHSTDSVFAATADASGHLYIAGSSSAAAAGGSNGVALAKFDHGGHLDTTFGTNGRITMDLAPGLNDRATAIGIGPDGMLYVAGVLPTSGTGAPADFFLMKFDTNGHPVPGFGSSGLVSVDVTGTGASDLVSGLAFDSHGKVYVTGEVHRPPQSDFAVVKFDAQGHVDAAFGDNGHRLIDFGGDDTPNAVAMDAADHLVLAGITAAGADYEFGVAMLDSNGNLVSGFGNAGLVKFGVSDSHASALAVALDRSGDIYLGGYTHSPQLNFAVAKLAADGTRDMDFGDGGFRTLDFGGNYSVVRSMLVDDDDHVLIAGNTLGSSSSDFAVAALDRNGDLIDAFNGSGYRAYDFGLVTETASAIVLDPVTRGVFLAGPAAADNASDFDFAAIRLPRGPRGDHLFADGFDPR